MKSLPNALSIISYPAVSTVLAFIQPVYKYTMRQVHPCQGICIVLLTNENWGNEELRS